MDKNILKKLADYAVREGTEHTTDGRWSVSYDELYYHFGEKITDANENGKLLEEESSNEPHSVFRMRLGLSQEGSERSNQMGMCQTQRRHPCLPFGILQ